MVQHFLEQTTAEVEQDVQCRYGALLLSVVPVAGDNSGPVSNLNTAIARRRLKHVVHALATKLLNEVFDGEGGLQRTFVLRHMGSKCSRHNDDTLRHRTGDCDVGTFELHKERLLAANDVDISHTKSHDDCMALPTLEPLDRINRVGDEVCFHRPNIG